MAENQQPRVFLSYARADRPRVTKIAEALSAAGLRVWWDKAIEGGSAFAKDIARELDAADVVVWSATSVESAWVLDEAGAGRDRGRLVPVQLDATSPPLGFRQLQAIDLSAWKGRAGDAKFAALVSAIQKLAGSAAVVPVARAAPASSGPSRRLLIGGAAGVAALAAGGFGAWRFMGQKTDDGTGSIVVLPFANLSGDPAQTYFADGLAEELRSALSQLPSLKVIGRTSSEKFRDAADLSDVAGQLGVANVLTGSVRRSPTILRIAAQLINGRTGVESWSRTYERPVGDALDIQSSIATGVVGALSQRLGKAMGTVAVGGTSNPEAQALFLQADSIREGIISEAQARQTLTLLDAAIAIDPNYALAYSLKSLALGSLSGFERDAVSVRAVRAKAAVAALRAIQLQPTSGRAQTIYANGLLSNLDIRGAVAGAKRAVQLEPGSVYALGGASRVLAGADPGLALELANRVIASDPFNARAFQGRAEALYNLTRYAEANAAGTKAFDLSNGARAIGVLFRSFLMLGRLPEARKVAEQQPIAQYVLGYTALLEQRAGNRAAADNALAALGGFDPALTAFDRARVYAQRGESTRALDALAEALAAKNSGLENIAFDNFLDPLRGDPRFKAIQDKIIPPDLIVRPAGQRA